MWETVVRELRAGAMPPPDRPRPDPATYDRFVAWLEDELDRAAAENPNPGRTEAFHRLNRTEYHHAVRDLLDLEIDVAEVLPADGAGYGFDNIAGVLGVSPTLVERYLAAARKISRVAVGRPALYLLEHGAALNPVNERGWTPLTIAQGVSYANLGRRWPEMEALLLELGATSPTAPEPRR